MKKHEDKLLIAGGGLVGLAAAILFADRFSLVELFEKRQDPLAVQGNEARSLQLVISARGWNTLRLLGFEDEIRSLCLSLKGRWHHHQTEEKVFEAYSPIGECISCISRESIYRLLTSKARAIANVQLQFENKFHQVDFARKELFFSRGINTEIESSNYDFLIGADGVRSSIAAQLNPGGEDFLKEINVYREISISGVNWERDAFHYWHTKTAMIGAFPVFDGGFSLFLVHKEADFEVLLQDPSATLFHSLFPEISSIIPEAMQLFAKAKGGILGSKSCQNWHHENDAVIVGDAAHAVLPFMGQGLNTGLEDLFILNQYLENGMVREGMNLANFENQRRPQAEAIRQISQDQFRYLTGKYEQVEYARRIIIASKLKLSGQLPTYSACAFSLEPFSAILEREERIKQSIDKNEEDELVSQLSQH